MSSTITEELVQEIRQKLLSLGERLWTNLYLEIQDGGEYLFISVDVENGIDKNRAKQICGLIITVVSPLIPERQEYSWSAVINVEDEVKYAIFSGTLSTKDGVVNYFDPWHTAD